MGYEKKAHFTACGYKFDRWYDIIWYEKMIAAHGENPKPFLPVAGIVTKTVNNRFAGTDAPDCLLMKYNSKKR